MKDLLKPAQRKASDQITKKLRQYGIACLWGEARSGKSRSFLDATRGYRTLVITEKSAISGVLSEAKEIGVEVDVINYQSVHKKDPDDYQLIVADECFKGDTEILTKRGFIRFDELIDGEEVAQTNLNGYLDFVKPIRNIHYEYDGNMITHTSYAGKGFSITATPNHRQPTINTMGDNITKRYNELPKTFKIPSSIGLPKTDTELTQNEKQIVCYQADGSYHSKVRGLFSFSKQRKIDEFLKIFPNANEVKPSPTSNSNVKPRRRFTTLVPNKTKKLSDFFTISDFTKEKAFSFIKYIIMWDGHIHSDVSWYYSCVDKDNVDFVNAVAVLAGLTTTQSVQVDDRKESYQDVHRLFMTHIGSYSMQKVIHTVEKYKGMVYCVEVPTSYIIVKQNKKSFITGNCHRFISPSQPKPPVVWKNVVKFTKGKFIILSSATPTAEGFGGLYYQLGLSSWSPFPYARFTLFFKDYGIPSEIYTGTRLVPSYKKTQVDKIEAKMKHLVVKLKRKKTGHKFESKDVFHNVSMNKQQKKIQKKLTDKFMFIKGKYEILADTPVKMLGKSHQLAGGIGIKAEPYSELKTNFEPKPKKVIKNMSEDERDAYEDSKYIWHELTYKLKKTPPKVDYIRENFDPETTIILSYYKHEQEYLSKIFPHTGSVTKMSTGVDLSHYKTMVIYSMSFSSANYFQVKARLMNVNRKTQMTVHYLVSGIDEYVLKAVQNKENFTSRWFKKNG